MFELLMKIFVSYNKINTLAVGTHSTGMLSYLVIIMTVAKW